MGPLGLSGHLGDRTAALVDGQLPAAQVERAWAHVHACPGCREAVEQQVAAKRALGGLRDGTTPATPASWLGPDALASWEQVARVDRAARRRTTLTAGAVGGGALTVGLAVAVVVGTTGVLGPAQVRPVPGDVRAGLLASPSSAPTTPTAPTAPSPGVTTVSWTGAHSGAETARTTSPRR